MTLQEIQQELKAPKNQYNSYGKFSYRSCEDILQAVKPLLAKYDDSLVLTDRVHHEGEHNYIIATAKFWEKGKDKPVEFSSTPIAVEGVAREAEMKKGQDPSQISGAASSYARKYALNGLFLIDDTKDADTGEYHNQSNSQQTRQQSYRRTGNQRQNNTAQRQQVKQTAPQRPASPMQKEFDEIIGQIAVNSGSPIKKVKAAIGQVLNADKNYQTMPAEQKQEKALSVAKQMLGGNK